MKGEVKEADLSSLSREVLTGVNSPRGHTTGYTLGPVGIVGVVFRNSLAPTWQIYSTQRSEPRLDSCHGG